MYLTLAYAKIIPSRTISSTLSVDSVQGSPLPNSVTWTIFITGPLPDHTPEPGQVANPIPEHEVDGAVPLLAVAVAAQQTDYCELKSCKETGYTMCTCFTSGASED